MPADLTSRLVAVALLLGFTAPVHLAQAQHHGEDPHGQGSHRDHGSGDHGSGDHGNRDHGRDRHSGNQEYSRHGHDDHWHDRYTPNGRQAWGGGRWERGWHDDRFGWWWLSGNGWYPYPAPVYPYPPYVPPTIVIQPALPALPPPALGPPPAQSWYYCNNPPGYFPQVAECSQSWQEVPVTSRR